MPSHPPDPLIPPGTNLRSFPFMPLDVTRLRESDLVAVATGDELRAAVLLWCAAWHQIPAGSLPDDDKTLAYLAGFGRNTDGWSKCRALAMRGFVLCNDSRFYHPVICEKVIDALARIEAGRTGAKSRWNKKKLDNSGRNAKAMPRVSNATDTDTDKDKVPSPIGSSPTPGSRSKGTNPRAQGTSLRQTEQNPRALGQNPRKQPNQGTQLPEDWTLPDEWLQWAIDQNLGNLASLSLEGERFRDYWWAKAGKDATKRDWFATWRNWTRRAAEITKQHGPTTPASTEPSPRALAQWRQARTEAEVQQDAASNTGKLRSQMTPKERKALRSQMTPKERKAFDKKIAKLQAGPKTMPKLTRKPGPRPIHVPMNPEEREAGLIALSKLNAS